MISDDQFVVECLNLLACNHEDERKEQVAKRNDHQEKRVAFEKSDIFWGPKDRVGITNTSSHSAQKRLDLKMNFYQNKTFLENLPKNGEKPKLPNPSLETLPQQQQQENSFLLNHHDPILTTDITPPSPSCYDPIMDILFNDQIKNSKTLHLNKNTTNLVVQNQLPCNSSTSSSSAYSVPTVSSRSCYDDLTECASEDHHDLSQCYDGHVTEVATSSKNSDFSFQRNKKEEDLNLKWAAKMLADASFGDEEKVHRSSVGKKSCERNDGTCKSSSCYSSPPVSRPNPDKSNNNQCYNHVLLGKNQLYPSSPIINNSSGVGTLNATIDSGVFNMNEQVLVNEPPKLWPNPNITISGINHIEPYNPLASSSFMQKQQVLNNQKEEHYKSVGLLKYMISPTFKNVVSDFTSAIFDEMKLTSFQRFDKRGNRSKLKLGFTGFTCRHCEGCNCNKNGRYFPASLQALTNQTTLLAIHKHLQSCGRVPHSTKLILQSYYEQHVSRKGTGEKHVHGQKRKYYRIIWAIMQGDTRTYDEQFSK